MSNEENQPNDASTKARDGVTESPSTKPPQQRSWFLIASVLLIAGNVFILGALGFLHVISWNFDFAISNVITLILLFVLFCSYLTWFTFFTPLPRGVRMVPAAICVVVVIALFAVLKIDRTSGELVPSFRYRWQPPADQLLEAAVVEDNADQVDLAAATDDDFSQFLGPNRNGYLPGPQLAEDWTTNPPRELWRRKVGAGWSAFAVVNGYAVTMEQRGDEELVTCYEVDTGELRWVNSISARHETLFGGVGPRSTPCIDGGRVYALGATGVLQCMDGATGETIWRLDVLEAFGSTVEQETSVLSWGRSNSPLIVDELVVVPAGGPPGGPFKSLVAINKTDGEIVWKGGNSQISYSSPTLATLNGKRQIILVNEDNIAGYDPSTGEELWSEPWPGNSTSNASVSQPHLVADDRLLITKGYGEGAAVIEVKEDGGAVSTEKLWWDKRLLKTKFTQACVIDGFAYGLSDGILECVDVTSGERCWKKPRYGHGQILGVGSHILVMAERGDLILVAADPDEFRELAVLQNALNGQTWNNVALFGNRLLVRNAEEAACLELPVASQP